MGKSLNDIRDMVNAAKNDGDNGESFRFDRLCEAVGALIGYIECGGDYRTGPAPLLPHGQDPSEGYLEDGRGGFVREAPAPGFMQPSGRRIPDEDRLRRQWPALRVENTKDADRLAVLSPSDRVAAPATNHRNDMLQWTPAELAIREAVLAVEAAGANPLLTDAVNLLAHARQKVAMFVIEKTPAG